jgi:hypothetical protein
VTKVAFVADVHVANHRRFGGETRAGVNDRARLCVDALRLACLGAKERGCEGLVVLGDLFDADDPTPQLVRAVQDALESAPAKTFLLLGNHDARSDVPGDHALAPLEGWGRVVDRPVRAAVGDVDLLLVPWAPGDVAANVGSTLGSRAFVPRGGGQRALLCLHAGIERAETPAYLRGARGSVTVDALEKTRREVRPFSRVFAGDWHTPSDADRVHQVGALCPTGWDNPGLNYGRVLVHDSETDQVEEFRVPGPRFVDLLCGDDQMPAALAVAREAVPDGSKIYVRRLSAPSDISQVGRDLAQLGADGWEVFPDQRVAAEAARRAAASVRHSETLDEALVAYVKKMDLPAGVDRGAVVEALRGYLRGGAT